LLDRALDLTKRVVFKKKNDLNAKKIVFVISAGRQHNGPQAAAMAVDLRETGTEVFVLCVGSHVVSRDQRIPSKPLRTHRLHVNSYDGLVKVANEIKGRGTNTSIIIFYSLQICVHSCTKQTV
jgi:NAD(P)H-hydrate repair Nnr-like enzyme with NAD(P)H-hydrate epimerase domain